MIEQTIERTEPMVQRTNNVLAEVAGERERQFCKWGEQDLTPHEWVSVLTEEVGAAVENIDRQEETRVLAMHQTPDAQYQTTLRKLVLGLEGGTQ